VQLKEGVTVKARVPRDATLRAAPMSNGPAVVAENVKQARFSGFRILADKEAPLTTGILLRDSSVEIDNVEIRGAGIGVEIRGTGNPVLRGNSIRECKAEGILMLGASTPWISHNFLQANKGANISARDGAKPVLLENQEVRK
jgi:hypothetical protein